MKYYSGLVIHDCPTALREHCEEEGMQLTLDSEGFRQVGHYWKNPLQVVYDWVVENDESLRVTLEETVEGESGSLGDLFTEFTYEDGATVNVETDWCPC